jgi:hypothetical protein
MTDFKDENRKIVTKVSCHFFKNLLLLAIFSYHALLKSYHIEWKFFADCVAIKHCLIIKLTKTRRKSDFLPIKN